MDVTLRPVTGDNWYLCAELELRDEQKGFLDPNAYTIAQSKFEPLTLLATYYGKSPVGLIAFGTDPEGTCWPHLGLTKGTYCIFRFMIDRRFQRKGIGRQAATQLIQTLSQQRDCSEIVVSYVASNVGARQFFISAGFQETSMKWGQERVLRIKISDLYGTYDRQMA